jgi:hypothetical protein
MPMPMPMLGLAWMLSMPMWIGRRNSPGFFLLATSGSRMLSSRTTNSSPSIRATASTSRTQNESANGTSAAFDEEPPATQLHHVAAHLVPSDESAIYGEAASEPGHLCTFYTSCTQTRPNLTLTQDNVPAEAVWMPLHAVATGLDGYLR